jgi:DNA invertase Pin-like site-specific DNA recombinase
VVCKNILKNIKDRIKMPKCYSYIRFSTPEQAKGDSFRRQLQQSKDWALDRGLDLDQTLSMDDRGLSAYKGVHKDKGALGEFYRLLDKGEIETGSYLIVESLDRLSRENPVEALTDFLNIIRADITVVTLQDRMEYSKEAIDNGGSHKLFVSLGSMIRAHEESALKSQRLKESWKNKRAKIQEQPMTGRLPAWLRLNKEKNSIETLPDRCRLVEQIFQMSKDGHGVQSISKGLNQKGIPEWQVRKNRKTAGWHKSYIQKILKNRAVIGEFQPHTIESGKRIPVGDPISNYFPKIIKESLFYEIQERLRRNYQAGGRTGSVTNLFGHVAKCGYCGGSIEIVNKGKSPKGNRYLVCDNARRGLGCQYHSWPYEDFEQAFLTICHEINISDLVLEENGKKMSRQAEIESQLSEIEGKIQQLNKNIQNYDMALADASGNHIEAVINHITRNMNDAFSQKLKLTKSKESLSNELDRLLKEDNRIEGHLDALKSLYRQINKKADNRTLRLKLRTQIRQLVARVDLFPDGLHDKRVAWDGGKELLIDSIFDGVKLAEEFYDECGDQRTIQEGPDGVEVSPSKEDIKPWLIKQQAKADQYVSENSGKEKRGFVIHFVNSNHKHVSMSETGYVVIQEIKDKETYFGGKKWHEFLAEINTLNP